MIDFRGLLEVYGLLMLIFNLFPIAPIVSLILATFPYFTSYLVLSPITTLKDLMFFMCVCIAC